MFTVVTKENATQHHKALKDLLSLDPALSLPNTQEEILFVCDHPQYGLVGGARLSQVDQSIILREHFDHLDFIKDTPCLIDGIFFHLPADHPVHEDDEAFEKLCRDFYIGLWESLNLFANQHQMGTLLTLTPVEEYNDIVYFGDWNFTAQYKLDETDDRDELVLGLVNFDLSSDIRLSA